LTDAKDQTLLLGQTLAFEADPFEVPHAQSARHSARGAVLVEAGRIVAVGEADALRAAHPRARTTDHGAGLILPGFIDAHAHYPQTAVIASWGLRLIDWLQTYTFPEEARFGDPAHAAAVAATYLDLLLAHGTTTAVSFCTSHPGSAEAFFAAAEARGMRTVAGKTCMDRNAPEALRDTPARAHDETRALIARWHGRGRAEVAITPRFTPTSSPAQLEALGALAAEFPGCPVQTHISEQTDEVAWVAALHPEARDYLDTYEAHGLVTPRTLLGHAIHLTPRERARIAEIGATAVHCPTSNTFIGSGLFDLAGRRAEGIGVALATDTGGGSSFSMLRTMAAAYEVGQLAGTALHPARLLWLATEAGAAALHLSGRVGRLAPGAEADLCVLDLASTPAIAQRAARAGDVWEALFPTMMMGDDRAVAATYVMGRRVGAAR